MSAPDPNAEAAPASDADLLRRYAEENSQAAFATLVSRHVDLVYSVARRQTGSASLAEDVAQSVFIELARQARRIKPGTPLVAWLHVVARRTAINALRDTTRRQSRERTAAELAAMKNDPPSPAWSAIEPLLDEAVETLPESDRAAILLRFFENKSLREVGAALGLSEDTAQKRVSRALDQLRSSFARRGLTLTSASLAADLSAHAIEIGPAGLAAAATANALTPAAVVAGTGLLNSIQLMTASKPLIAAGVALILVLASRRVWRRPTPDLLAMQTVSATTPLSEQAPSAPAPNASGLTLATGTPGKTPSDPMEDNAYRAKLVAQAKTLLDGFYGPLFKGLALTPRQTEEFKNLLVEKQLIRTDVARAAATQGIVLGDDLYTTAVIREQREVNDRIKALLGSDTAFGDYADYEKSFTKRMVINRLAEMVATTDPLSEIQTEQLLKTWIETANPSKAHDGIIGMNLVTAAGNDHPPFGLPGAAILRKAKPLLSAEQFRAFQDLRAELLLEKAGKLNRP